MKLANKLTIKSYDLLSFLENENSANVLRLKTLSLGPHSDFLTAIIRTFKYRPKNSPRIYVAYIKKNVYIDGMARSVTRIVGWAQRKTRKIRGKYFHIGVFVDPSCRHYGIGSALIKKAKKSLRKNRLIAYPFDEKGKKFFIKNRVKIGKNYK